VTARDQKDPVFVFGFFRSGTTLVDKILGSHSRVQTMEELPCVPAMRDVLAGPASGYPEAGYPRGIGELNVQNIRDLRQVYLQEASGHGSLDPEKVLVDKMPLNTLHLPLIRRCFPSSKLIFVIRHPVDVCLSCFMQPSTFNQAPGSAFTMEDVTNLYVRVMRLWMRYKNLLSLDTYQLRYEDLVDDFETTVRSVTDYLDLPWEPTVLSYHQRAALDKRVQTPSYHQVSLPIYENARYRWERYASLIPPEIFERLEPMIENFGYDAV
jgi:hypothetical protein